MGPGGFGPRRGFGGRPGPFGPPWGRGPGRHGRGPGGGRRRPRVSRGEVRAAVLLLLGEGPMHGYQLMQEMEERSGGAWQPSPGSIYPTLQLLADEGLIASTPQDGKNVFTLTEAGATARAALEGPAPWETMAGDGFGALIGLRRSMALLVASIKQISVTGSDRQVEQATAILNNARKAIYRLLAEDEEPVDS